MFELQRRTRHGRLEVAPFVGIHRWGMSYPIAPVDGVFGFGGGIGRSGGRI